MWLLTQIADGFDRMVQENDVFLEQAGTRAASDFLHDDSAWDRALDANRMGGIAMIHAIHTFATPFSKAFVDTARIGDGIRKGGWGYGEDALRALVVAGPALKAVRVLAGTSKAVDFIVKANNCTWVASARSLRFTGNGLFARVSDLARISKVPIVNAIQPRWIHELTPALRGLGASVREWGSPAASAFGSMAEATRLARHTINGVVLFSVEWVVGGQRVGHTLMLRNGMSGVRIIDRTGKVAKSLADLERIVPGYQGIATAVPYGSAAVVQNAAWVTAAEWGVTPLSALALQVWPYMLEQRENRKPAGTTPRLAAAAPKSPSATSSARKPSAAGVLRTNQECVAPNSDSPVVCSHYYTYVVAAGDSLALIAQRVYRDQRKWRILYEFNRAKLGPNPHDIAALKVGMELDIPTR